MTNYEGLFILNLTGRDEGLNDVIEKIRAKLGELGAKIDTVQKMDKRSFARVANRKMSSGHYVNFLFAGGAEVPRAVHTAFERDEDVYRILITRKETTEPAVAAA